MRFLVDNSLSPLLATLLTQFGHHAVHVRDLGIANAADEVVFRAAREQDRAVLSAESDFGKSLALGGFTQPSVTYFRSSESLEPKDQVEVLTNNLTVIEQAVKAGSIMVIRHQHLHIRQLPIDDYPG